MEFRYCTICGERLVGKEIGDEGILPYCQSCQRPYFSIFNVSVLVAVMKDDKVLLIKQNYMSQNNWGLVAGYIQKGETAEETVIREVEEETGLKVREGKYIKSYFHVKNEMLMLGFLHRPHLAHLPVLLALPEVRPGFGADHARFIQQQLANEQIAGIKGLDVERSGAGHAGALRALEIAVQRVAQGQDDVCVVGGADSYLEADTLDWLDGERRLMRAEIRSGFAPGEGASMLAIASNAARASLGLPSLARIRSVATAQETRRADSDEGLLGEALTDAIARAGRALRARELFDDVYCDVNGERARTDDWGFALLRTSSMFRDGTAYTMSTAQCGDLGAASAAFNCALAAHAWQRGYAKGPTALVWGASWTGLRGAAVLEHSAG